MTILDYCISLNSVQNFLVVLGLLGSCGFVPLSVKVDVSKAAPLILTAPWDLTSFSVRGHSITTWTRWGEGSKMSFFVHVGGWVQKMAKFCPRSC